jgi:CRP-like cAMP-binding protein
MTQTLTLPKKPVNFFESISPYVRLDSENKKALLQIMMRHELPAGTVIISVDAVCNQVYYFEQGLARSFYWKDGKEITERFITENSFACSMYSYITKESDHRQVELLEPSVIWTMPYTELDKLYNTHHKIERLGRLLASLEVVEVYQRLNDLHFATAHERYQKFIHSNPSLLQRVSLGMIASYLGITQETLSRIRAQI